MHIHKSSREWLCFQGFCVRDLQASVALVQSLQRCISPDVTLRPLADKFARLALQLLARYATWLTQGLATVPPPLSPPSTTESTVGSVSKTSSPQVGAGYSSSDSDTCPHPFEAHMICIMLWPSCHCFLAIVPHMLPVNRISR